MSKITIIGTGRMGSAIGAILTAGGASVEYLGRRGGPVTGDIVILAVPYAAIADIGVERSGELVDRIVVEISNPVERQALDGLLVGEGSSAAAELAGLLPSSRILKAAGAGDDERVLGDLGVTEADLPLVALRTGRVLHNPGGE